MKVFDHYNEEIKTLCKENKVKTLFAFGSVLTENFKADSDIDLLVDIDETDPFAYTDHYFALKFKLEELFKRHIDLLEERAICNQYFKEELNKTKVLLYG